jgi:hypothetical protein
MASRGSARPTPLTLEDPGFGSAGSGSCKNSLSVAVFVSDSKAADQNLPEYDHGGQR